MLNTNTPDLEAIMEEAQRLEFECALPDGFLTIWQRTNPSLRFRSLSDASDDSEVVQQAAWDWLQDQRQRMEQADAQR